MNNASRQCVSNTPACSGIQPCEPCWNIIRMAIVPRAMVLAGGPFSERHSPWPVAFISAFTKAWEECQEVYSQNLNTSADVGADAGGDAGDQQMPLPGVLERAEQSAVEEALEDAAAREEVPQHSNFLLHYARALMNLSPEEKADARILLAKGELPGYENVSEIERGVIAQALALPEGAEDPEGAEEPAEAAVSETVSEALTKTTVEPVEAPPSATDTDSTEEDQRVEEAFATHEETAKDRKLRRNLRRNKLAARREAAAARASKEAPVNGAASKPEKTEESHGS